MKKGFTLIELIVVVIVIGILATLAVPQYLRATERAKAAKARHALGLIGSAEKLYRADQDTYVTVATKAGLNADPGLGAYVELSDVGTDKDWDYAVAAGGAGISTSYTVTASRIGAGGQAGKTISLTESGVWGGTLTKGYGGEA